ncbi:hypothetical protein [Sphingomonas sp. 22176]|uniref:hypothetical protein n=1 Tax=Sphingomonas sp. 22176 TaxID=3453884 RepID=UPI003F84C247
MEQAARQGRGVAGRRGGAAAPLLAPGTDGAAAAAAIDGWLSSTLPRRSFSPVSGDPQPNPD